MNLNKGEAHGWCLLEAIKQCLNLYVRKYKPKGEKCEADTARWLQPWLMQQQYKGCLQKNRVMKWGSVAHGFFFFTLLVQFIYSMLAGISYPKDFRMLLCHRFLECFSCGVTVYPHQAATATGLQSPAASVTQPNFSITQPVSLLHSFPLDWHNHHFPTSVVPQLEQGQHP